MPDPSEYFCAHCGSQVRPDADQHDGLGSDGTIWWCSEVCRQVVIDGLWPTAAGPATHDEMVARLEAQQ